jgi:4-hydroxymandelate oxidase
VDLEALEQQAKEVLDPAVWDYYAGGSEDEITLADNVAAWSRLRLRPRVLRDASMVDTSTTVLGTRVAGLTRELIDRAGAAGYRALVVTVDVPVFGHRRRDDRNRFVLPDGVVMANIRRTTPSVEEGSGLSAHAARDLIPGVTADVLGDIIARASVPVAVKGVLRGDDAVRCLDAGAAAVIVSNHGGRQLDTAVSGVRALPAVVDADGGVRRGTDVLKALALGARAVLVGRPVIWALATGGEEGVRALLDGFRLDAERAFALAGARSVTEVTPDLLWTDAAK